MRISLFLILGSLFGLCSCSEAGNGRQKTLTDTIPAKKSGVQKAGSSFTDTLVISGPSAVFYSPDSLQKGRIEAEMDKGVFGSIMHEYENQFRVSHIELKENWKKIRIIDAMNYRYLQFIRSDGKMITVDLDSRGDPCGLFAFDPVKNPQSIDMMNVGTQLYYYFGQK